MIKSTVITKEEMFSTFSPYVLRMTYIPGRERSVLEEKTEKARERELFDLVDDYIEQA